MQAETLAAHLQRVLQAALGNPSSSMVEEAKQRVRNLIKTSQVLRASFKFIPLGLSREETIKVEVNLNESAALYPLVDVDIGLLDDDGNFATATVRSYDIDEMLGTKTRALVQRSQGRDLFNLCHAWQLSQQGATRYKVDGARAMAAFQWYLKQEGSTPFGIEQATAALNARLRDRGFCSDM